MEVLNHFIWKVEKNSTGNLAPCCQHRIEVKVCTLYPELFVGNLLVRVRKSRELLLKKIYTLWQLCNKSREEANKQSFFSVVIKKEAMISSQIILNSLSILYVTNSPWLIPCFFCFSCKIKIWTINYRRYPTCTKTSSKLCWIIIVKIFFSAARVGMISPDIFWPSSTKWVVLVSALSLSFTSSPSVCLSIFTPPPSPLSYHSTLKTESNFTVTNRKQ